MIHIFLSLFDCKTENYPIPPRVETYKTNMYNINKVKRDMKRNWAKLATYIFIQHLYMFPFNAQCVVWELGPEAPKHIHRDIPMLKIYAASVSSYAYRTLYSRSPRTRFNSFSVYFPLFPTISLLFRLSALWPQQTPGFFAGNHHNMRQICGVSGLAPDFPLISCLPPLLCPFRAAVSAFSPICHRFFPICHRKTGGN